MTNSLTPLEERRLAELRHYVSARALDASAEPDAVTKPRRVLRPRRPFVPALALAAATATAVAVAVVMTSSGAVPITTHQGTGTGHTGTELTGYTVKRAPDGVVTITLTDYRHTSQLSSQLQADGIPAMVVYIPAGEDCEEPDAAMVNGPRDYSMPGGVYSLPKFLKDSSWQMQINPSHIKPGQSLLFGISDGGKEKVTWGRKTFKVSLSGSLTYLVTGRLTACQYHPAPPISLPSFKPTLPPGATLGTIIEEPGGITFGGH
jgi:hypothetical protein